MPGRESGADQRPLPATVVSNPDASHASAPESRDLGTGSRPHSAHAERLIKDIHGVLAAAVVFEDNGLPREVHVLSIADIKPLTIVKDIERAWVSRFGYAIDRRRISIAQIAEDPPRPIARPEPAVLRIDPLPEGSSRSGGLELVGFQTVSHRGRRHSVRVTIRAGEKAFKGEAHGANVAGARLETFAKATLSAMAKSVVEMGERGPVTLSLAGVTMVRGFDVPSVLVSATVSDKARSVTLAGTAQLEGSRERAVIKATVRAVDRWARMRPEPDLTN